MLNMLDEYKTLTGMTFNEVLRKMGEVLPPQAYKEIQGQGVALTDIDPNYLTPVLVKCFGLPGAGWWYDYDASLVHHDRETKVNRNNKEYTIVEVGIPKFSLWYRYVDADGNICVSEPIVANGASDNRNLSYAMKGALTNALSQAVTKMLWQLLVYQGKLDHKNAGAKYKAQKERSNKDNSNGSKPKVETESTVATAISTPEPEPVAEAVEIYQIPEKFDRTKQGEEPVYSLEWAHKVVVPSEAKTLLAGKTLDEVAKDTVLGPSVINYLAGWVPKKGGDMFEPGDNETFKNLQRAANLIMEAGEVKDLRTKKRITNNK